MSTADKKAEVKKSDSKSTPARIPNLKGANQHIIDLYTGIDDLVDVIKTFASNNVAQQILPALSEALTSFQADLMAIEQTSPSPIDAEFNRELYYVQTHAQVYELVSRSKIKRIANLSHEDDSIETLLEEVSIRLTDIIRNEKLSIPQRQHLSSALAKEKLLLEMEISLKFEELTGFGDLLTNLADSSSEKPDDKKAEKQPAKKPEFSLVFKLPGTDLSIDLNPAQDLFFSSLRKNKKKQLQKDNANLSKIPRNNLTEEIFYSLKMATNYMQLGSYVNAISLLEKAFISFNNRTSSPDKDDLLQTWGMIYGQRLLGHCYEQQKRYGNAKNSQNTAYLCYTTAIQLLVKLDGDKNIIPPKEQLLKIRACFIDGLSRIKEKPPEPVKQEPRQKKPREKKYQIILTKPDVAEEQAVSPGHASDPADKEEEEENSHPAKQALKKPASPPPIPKKELVTKRQKPLARSQSSFAKTTKSLISKNQRPHSAGVMQNGPSNAGQKNSMGSEHYQFRSARPFGHERLRNLPRLGNSNGHNNQLSLSDSDKWPALSIKPPQSIESPQVTPVATPVESSPSSALSSEPPVVAIHSPPDRLPQPLAPSLLAEPAPIPLAPPIAVTPALPVVESPASQILPSPSLPDEKSSQTTAPNPAITANPSPSPAAASSEPLAVAPPQPSELPLSAAPPSIPPVLPREIKTLCREIEEAEQALKYAKVINHSQQDAQQKALELIEGTIGSLSAFLFILPHRNCRRIQNLNYNGFNLSPEGLTRTMRKITQREDLQTQLSLVRDYLATKLIQLRSPLLNRWRPPSVIPKPAPTVSSQHPSSLRVPRGKERLTFMPVQLPRQPAVASNPNASAGKTTPLSKPFR